MTHTVAAPQQQSHSRSTRRVTRALTLAAAAAIAVIVWTISSPILGIDLVAGSGASAQTVGPAATIAVPVIAGALAWGLLALLERRGRAGRIAWQIIGWAVLAVSLLGPITTAASLTAMIPLVIMHLSVGICLIVGLPAAGKNA
jgi:hypothetical protein